MLSSTLPGLPTALLAASNAGTDLVYVTVDPFGVTDDRKQDRTNFFAQVPVPVGLGRPSSIQGSLLFYASTNANSVSFRANTPAASLVYEWPNASPTVGQILSASAPVAGVVTLTWVADTAGVPGGLTTQVQYNNAGAFGGVSGFTSDGTNVIAGSGNLRATSPRIITNILDANGLEIIGLTATATAVNSINIANATTTNPVTLTTVGDANTGLTLTCAGTGIFTVTGNAIINAGTGATTIGEASLGAEQLRVTSVSASRVAESINSLANSTVDLVQWNQNVDDTATVANLLTVSVVSNGAAAAGFGTSNTIALESSTTAGRTAAIESIFWKVATDGSRSSIWSLSTTSLSLTSPRLLVCPSRALTDGAAATILTMTLGSNTGAGCVVHVTIVATDGAAWQTLTFSIYFAATNNGGSMSATAGIAGTAAEDSPTGTLTATVATTTGAGTASLQINANSSLTDPGITCWFTVDSNSEQAISITT